jgi:hypothetical protein
VPDAARAAAALQAAKDAFPGGTRREAIELALQQSREGFGFVRTWEVAGPFRQDGRDYADLFDFVFPPETDAAAAKWKPLPPRAGGAPTWLVDLRSTIGRQECVAYAQTWLHSDREQAVQFELGSDCLAKIWLDRTLIHTNWALRALRPGADKIPTTLHAGWNVLRIKVAQRGDGGAFCLRLVQPEGALVTGVRISANAPGKN